VAQGDADACRDEYVEPFDAEGFAQRFDYAPGYLFRLADVVDVVQEHRELVPAHARYHVSCAHDRRRSPTATKSWSPALYPRLSLTTLNSSMSRKSTANCGAGTMDDGR